jgi:hypothetical protein
VSAGAAQVRASAAPVVRRVVVYGILFVLVVLVANGAGDLLTRLLDLATGAVIATAGTGGLAVALTFTLIGGPLAAVLGWFAWRRLADPLERASVAWALYLVGTVTVALIAASTALLDAAAAALTGDRFASPAATGLVWAVIWAGHRYVLRRSDRRPTRLRATATVIGAAFGLALGAGAAIRVLTVLFDNALAGASDAIAGDPWWFGAGQALIWAVGGAAVWWWHWQHEGGRAAATPLAAVALVGVGILGGCLVALAGTGTVLFVLLRLAVDRSEPLNDLVDPLGLALAAALVGSLVGVYHRGVVRGRGTPVRDASSLATAGIALVAAATGIGVIVNALLAALAPPLAADTDPRTLVLAGISSALVGAPVWWLAWRPLTALRPERRRTTGRSVYLVVVFGVSAVVALVTLLVIGYRLFDRVLGGDAGLLESIRAPLGLLVATVLVAGYHYSVWRGDRAASAAEPAPPPAAAPPITELVVIMGAGGSALAAHLREHTGARVEYWQRSGVSTSVPSAEQVTDTLAGITGDRVVLLIGTDGSVAVLPVLAVPPDGPDEPV